VTTLINNGFSREMQKAFVSTAMEPSTSLQVPTTEMGSTLPETALEGATLSETTLEGAMLSEVKSRQKRFTFLPLFLKTLIERSLPYESEKAQAEVQKIPLVTSISPFFFPFLPRQVITKVIPFGASKEKEEEIVSKVAKRDLSSKSETETIDI
jgi:hypothetical protein